MSWASPLCRSLYDTTTSRRVQWASGPPPPGAVARIVAHDQAALLKGWRAAAVRDLDEAKGRELTRLDLMEAEAWAAWEVCRQQLRCPTSLRGTPGSSPPPSSRPRPVSGSWQPLPPASEEARPAPGRLMPTDRRDGCAGEAGTPRPALGVVRPQATAGMARGQIDRVQAALPGVGARPPRPPSTPAS
jgi:hypothetical protein